MKLVEIGARQRLDHIFHVHQDLVLCSFLYAFYAVTPLTNLHQFLIYARSFLV